MAADLAEDCLFAVFTKLETLSDRNAFGLTCRHWLAVQSAARTSLSLKFSYDSNVYEIYSRYLPRLLTRFPKLRSLSVAGCSQLTEAALWRLRYSGRHLSSLSFYYCGAVSDGELSFISAGCPRLVSIALYRSSISDLGLERLAGSCPALLDVNLSHCAEITDNGVAALSRSCRRLRALVITSCAGVSGRGLAGCSSTLAYLEAESCALTGEGLRNAVSGGGLEYLNVAGLRNWSGGDGLAAIGGGHAVRLRVLNLRMCRFVGDQSVAAIAEGCPQLEEWSLALCHEIRVPGWAAVAAGCRNLRVLHVNRCRNLCDGGLAALRGGCRRLDVLFIQGCPRVTTVGMEAFRLARASVELKEDERVYVGPRLDDFFS